MTITTERIITQGKSDEYMISLDRSSNIKRVYAQVLDEHHQVMRSDGRGQTPVNVGICDRYDTLGLAIMLGTQAREAVKILSDAHKDIDIKPMTTKYIQLTK